MLSGLIVLYDRSYFAISLKLRNRFAFEIDSNSGTVEQIYDSSLLLSCDSHKRLIGGDTQFLGTECAFTSRKVLYLQEKRYEAPGYPFTRAADGGERRSNFYRRPRVWCRFDYPLWRTRLAGSHALC
jgi:hypothetical protein